MYFSYTGGNIVGVLDPRGRVNKVQFIQLDFYVETCTTY